MGPPPVAAVANFVHPQLALAALALAAVPLIIHLLNRRRFHRVPWAAMYFLLAASRRSAQRVRFEQFLLLALRVFAVALVGLAVARPYLSFGGFGAAGGSAVHRVLLVDDSLSMRLTGDDGAGGRPRFTHATELAAKLLESFPQNDPVSVVRMATPAAVVVRGSFDRRRVRDTVAAMTTSQCDTDVTGALAACADLLDEIDVAPGNAAVYLLSDMSPRAWGVTDDAPGGTAGALTAALLDRAHVHILPCGGEKVTNAAITRFAARDRLIAQHVPLQLEADIANFGDRRAQDAQLHVLRGDRIVRRVPVPDIGPDGHATVTFSIAPGDPGDLPLEARLYAHDGDALADDDRRYLALHVSRNVPILIVEGRSAGTWGQAEGDAGFLAVALAPRVDPREPTRLAPTRVSTERWLEEPLDDYPMMVLCNVDRLSPAAWARIETFVSAGGGLLITAGDALDLENYNNQGYRDGAGVMPARLRAPADDDMAEGFVRFVATDQANELMRDFFNTPASSLFRARVTRRLLVDADDPSAEVLARFSDGSVALLARAFGEGRVALLTTSADMSWTNLPAKGDYVSLAQKLAEYLSRPAGGAVNLICGQTYERFLSTDEALRPVRVIQPDGATSPAETRRVDERMKIVFHEAKAAGFYHTGAGGEQGLFAANVPPAESDPNCLDEKALAAIFKGEFTYGRDDAALARMTSGDVAAEWANPLIHLALFCLACETWVAMRIGANRK